MEYEEFIQFFRGCPGESLHGKQHRISLMMRAQNVH